MIVKRAEQALIRILGKICPFEVFEVNDSLLDMSLKCRLSMKSKVSIYERN